MRNFSLADINPKKRRLAKNYKGPIHRSGKKNGHIGKVLKPKIYQKASLIMYSHDDPNKQIHVLHIVDWSGSSFSIHLDDK